SVDEPETAFTFAVMREYDIHSLQAKISAYDFFLTLRRLTDNVHTHLVNVFMVATRVWRLIKDKIRLGPLFDLNKRFLKHRPEDAMVVYCPVCPDPDINMPKDWWNTPDWL
ncbi:hypothetical protein MPER_00272, partial [Moniliophthora perniciosa FA553]